MPRAAVTRQVKKERKKMLFGNPEAEQIARYFRQFEQDHSNAVNESKNGKLEKAGYGEFFNESLMIGKRNSSASPEK
ncbi:hypothetical protein TNCV_2204991 [Trichonephila clavipes]|nr:hypothetical protein TNCV_2204991 [Trichonephila clavipes]